MVPFSLYMYRYTRRGMKSDVNEITNAWATRVESERGTQAELKFITSSTMTRPNNSHSSGEPEGPESGASTAPTRDCSLPTLPRCSVFPGAVPHQLRCLRGWQPEPPKNGAAVPPSTRGELAQLCFPVSPSQLLPGALHKVQWIHFQLLFRPANNRRWFDSSESHCVAKGH